MEKKEKKMSSAAVMIIALRINEATILFPGNTKQASDHCVYAYFFWDFS